MVRSLNNPNDALTLMAALTIVMPVGTMLAQLSVSGNGMERIFTDRDAMALSALFPAMLLRPGLNTTRIGGGRLYDGTVQISARMYDRWDNQAATLDAIYLAEYADLLRMAANLENNNNLTSAGTNQCLSIPTIEITDKPVLDEEIPGIRAVFTEMMLTINVLPYGI